MRNIRLKDVVLAIAIVGAVWIGLVSWLEPGGYCRAQSRYISDGDLLAAAVIYDAQRIEGLSSKPTNVEASAYVRDNPGCCAFRDDLRDFKNDAFQRAFGSNRWIQIIYPLKSTAISVREPEHRAYDSLIKMTRCADVVDVAGQAISIDRMHSSMRANQERRK